MDWVMKLAEAVNWRALDLDVAWGEIEAALGSPLPADFKRFCEVFGRGEFCDGLVVYSTDGAAKHELLNELAEDRVLAESLYLTRLDPHGLYEKGGTGYISWGRIAQGHSLYWLAGRNDPDRWPVMMNADTGEWVRFDVSMSEFVFRMFTDESFDYNVVNLINRLYYRPSEGQW